MAARLAFSRITVLSAYDQLVAEGYLESRQGAGTYVCTDLPDGYLKLPPPREVPPPQKPAPPRPLSGMPALDEFPFALWARIAGSVWRSADTGHLQHIDPAGYLPLRQAVATYLRAARGVTATPDQILITSGLQEGLRLVAESVIPRKKALILEDPGYPGLYHSAEGLPHPLAFTAVDRHGATVPGGPPDAEPGMLLISPSRQYPLGMTMPLSRRLEILDWARATGALVLEDDYDSEFRYAGRPVQSLQGLDGGRQVIYGGSFSKSLFLSLRLGYLVLPARLAADVVRHRNRTATFPPLSPQLILTRFMEEGHFARHLRRLRGVHKRRLALFFRAADAHLSRFLAVEPTEAGLHLVAFSRGPATRLPDTKLAALAHGAGIGAVPLSRTYVRAEVRHGLLIGFANLPDAEIDSRLRHLADSFSDALKDTGTA
jgi:GntR family transcriptional regulator/MocR family aminotransferase